MEKEYIYLVGLIIAVVLFDLLLKKRKKKLNEDVVVYTKRTLSLFVKETEDLVQMRRSTVRDVHSFLAKIKDLD